MTAKQAALDFITKTLNCKETTSARQAKNGTQEFTLPHRLQIGFEGSVDVKFTTYKSGYVRVDTGAASLYQINKTVVEEEKVPMHKIYYASDGDYVQLPTGEVRTRLYKKRVLIEDEVERLIYLSEYIDKNYMSRKLVMSAKK